MTEQLRGVLTALATPFTVDDQIDAKVLRAVVARSINGGVHGVVACGSTGEFAAMSSDERKLVVETVIDEAAGRLPVIAQTGAVSTTEAIRLSKHAEATGATALMLVTPYYETLTIPETITYLERVAGSVQIPIMLYNLPSATGVNLSPDLVARLLDRIPNIKFIKDTSADMAQAGQLIHLLGDRIGVFVGWDSLLIASLAEGAAGVMAGTANIFPSELVAIYDDMVSGNLTSAQERWASLYPLMNTIMTSAFIPAVKAAVNVLGVPVGDPRHPLLPVDAATQARIKELVLGLPKRA